MGSTGPRRLGREAAWVAAGQAAAALGALVGVAVLTNVLDPMTYGELALGITLASLAQLVAWSPITAAVLRFFSPAREAAQIRPYLYSVRTLATHATVAIVGLGIALCLGLWALGASRWTPLALAALAFSVLSGYESVLDRIQVAARNRPVAAGHQGLGVWLRYLLAVVLVLGLGATSTWAMLGFVAGTSVTLGSQLVFFRRKIAPAREPSTPSTAAIDRRLRQMRAYAWPVAVLGVFTWVQAVSDRWVLQGFSGTAAVGLYTVVYQLGYYPMSAISTVLLQFASPLLFAHAGEASDTRRLDRAWRMIVMLMAAAGAVTAVGTLVAALLHERLFALVGPEYQRASAYLPWMVLAGGLFSCGQAASQAMMVGVSTRRLVVPTAVTSTISLVLYALGARTFGLGGVVAANVAFAALYAVWMGGLARTWRKHRRQTPAGDAMAAGRQR